MSSGVSSGRMYLIDAHSLIFQVFHAIREPMTSPSGVPTNALYGFTRDLLVLRNEIKPDYWLCAFDVSGPTFRDKLYPQYKANRAPMPTDLEVQLPLIRQLLDALHVPVVGIEGFEADDIVATVARTASQRGLDVFICTSDKDCRQLIDDHVRLYNLRKRQEFGRDELLKDWGITPEQAVDLQTLVGDSVDNVPGVAGIGVKTAAKLLQEFGTLDRLLAEVQGSEVRSQKPVGPKTWESLRNALPVLEKGRRLVRLDTAVPMAMDWEGWRLREWDTPRLLALFQEWGFRTFAETVRSSSSVVRGKEPETLDSGQPSEDYRQGELFPFGANAQPEAEPTLSTTDNGQRTTDNWQATYHLVDTPEKFQTFYRQLRKQKRIAVDLETTGLDSLRCEIVGYAFCWKPGEAWYLAVRGPEGEAVLDPVETLDRLRPVLEDQRVAKINQNLKYDLLVLRHHGVTVSGIAGDSMVADYLLRSGERSHKLEELAKQYLHYQVIPITDLIGKKGKNQIRMDQVATAKVAEYSGEDADVAWRLCERLEPELATCGLAKLYDDLEVPLIEVLAELEFNGIRLDVPLLKRLSREMTQQLADIERDIHALAGHPFNIASLPQLRKVLFEELKLPPQHKTSITGAPSTDQESLEKLAALGHPLPKKILEHRQVAKLKGTYVDALPKLVNPATGRIHASFNQTVAATGRLSGSEPNLQNIPIRREQGEQIRQAFLPEEDWLLLTADYSQIELRLLAHFSGDADLRRAFAEDRDIHASVAAQIFGVTEPDVTAEMRRMAKTVNFGVIYGMSAHGLAERLGLKRDEAARFIDAYFARYPKVLEYQTRLLENCRQTGYVFTLLGRRRRFDRAAIRKESTYQQRNATEREAINMEIQGSAADLLKLAMLNIYRRLRLSGLRTRMLLTVHDELVFEVPPDEFDEATSLVHEEMTAPLEKLLRLDVPLKVDVAAGPNWLDVEEVGEPLMNADRH